VSAGGASQSLPKDEPVTVVVTRKVRPGHEAAFEAWLAGIGEEAAKFPGLLGRKIIRPEDHQHPEFVSVFKFDSYGSLKRWTESEERRRWLEAVRPHTLDEHKDTILSGLETWFTLPHRPDLPPPPRYKMLVMTLLVVYPLGMAFNALLGPPLQAVPAALRTLLIIALEMALMTYVIMPRVTRLFRRWLYPGA